MPNLRLSIEWARSWDYPEARELFPPLGPTEPNGVSNGVTKEVADAVFSMLIFEW